MNYRKIIGSVLFGFYITVHPFDGFWDLKHEKTQTFKAALIILIMVVLAVVLRFQAAGFLFRPTIAEDANIIFNILSVVLPLILWTIVNWAITTLFDGKGSMRDIFISTTFALLPILLFIPQLALTHLLIIEEGAFIYTIDVIVGLWCAGLLLAGNASIHEYSMSKTVIASIATIVGIAALLFLSGVFYSALSQLIGFFTTIVMEIRYR